ncbi:plasmid mobilization protein [Castellaniella sp.]|uniref:plasmid mobilization protein n=1 Tax=Castellaniella sp. TaxID=1955812 RepID=UPI003A9171AF
MENKKKKKPNFGIRPPMAEEDKRKTVTVKLNKKEKEELRQKANEAGLAVSTYIRTKALGQDETAIKKFEMYSNLNRSFGLLKALYRKYESLKTVEDALARVEEELRKVREELKNAN